MEPNKIIAQTDSLGMVEIKACVSVDTASNTVTEYSDGYDGCFIVDGKIYIEFVGIKVATDGGLKHGSLKQNDDENMFVYTSDYERLDIPANLDQAYKYFDEDLNAYSIEYIKNSTKHEMMLMHMGLGLWIRNNWIYSSTERIAKAFLEKGITHPDDISGYIIFGYHEYLNNRPSDINSIIPRMRVWKFWIIRKFVSL